MGKKTPSAYELATQRIIVSNYAEQIAREKQREKEAREEIDALPDFVDDWKRPDKEETKQDLIDANTGKGMSKLYTAEEIKEHRKIQLEKEMEEMKYMTPEKEKEVVNFSEPIREVHWYGHFTSYSGFSRLNRAMAFGLSNCNIKVKVDIQDTTIDINEATLSELQMLSRQEIRSDAPKVYGATIPLRLAHGGPKILYTMMESSETLHRGYVDRLNLYNEIWVPTNQGKDLFKKNGVTPPVYVMPLGVDTTRYNPDAKPMNFKFGLKGCVFLSVFKWGYRKGYDVLLKSFMEEFSSEDDVSLLIVSRTDVNHNPEKIAQDFKAIRNGIAKDNSDLPHIALYDKPIKEKDMPRIYAAANAFVLVSLGEGFGLPYYEAAACGLPIIGSNCSGQKEFLSVGGAYLVEPDGYVTAKINGQLSNLAKHCGFYEDQVFPNFGRPAIEQTKAHMRDIYEHYDEALARSVILSKNVRDNYTWDMAVNRVNNRLKEFC